MRTKIQNTTRIEVQVNTTDAARFEFPCSAHSDDSTPVTIRWYQVDGDDNETPVTVVPGKRIVTSNGSLIVELMASDDFGWGHFGGAYRCKATNGYSVDVRDVFINVVDYESPKGNRTTTFTNLEVCYRLHNILLEFNTVSLS